MKNEELTMKLMDSVLDKAEYFLSSYQEFYPFAIAYDKGKIVEVDVFLGDDHPNPTEHLSDLKKQLILNYHSYAIGINATHISQTSSETQDVIEIRVTVDDQDYSSCFMPYLLKDSEVEFLDMFTED